MVWRYVEMIIDAVLPPKPRTERTKRLSIEEIPLTPTSHDLLGVRITTLMDYQKDEVRDLVQSLKYDSGGHAAHLCASILAEYLTEELAGENLFSTKKILLCPVPLHPSRERERGYNQIRLVLDALPPNLKDGTLALLSPTIVERSRETKPQTRLPRSERLSNVAGAFSASNAEQLKNTHVFLFDDVTTTGATLANAGNPLRRAGATVSLIALARA